MDRFDQTNWCLIETESQKPSTETIQNVPWHKVQPIFDVIYITIYIRSQTHKHCMLSTSQQAVANWIKDKPFTPIPLQYWSLCAYFFKISVRWHFYFLGFRSSYKVTTSEAPRRPRSMTPNLSLLLPVDLMLRVAWITLGCMILVQWRKHCYSVMNEMNITESSWQNIYKMLPNVLFLLHGW